MILRTRVMKAAKTVKRISPRRRRRKKKNWRRRWKRGENEAQRLFKKGEGGFCKTGDNKILKLSFQLDHLVAGTLLCLHRQYIAMPYIALTWQAWIFWSIGHFFLSFCLSEVLADSDYLSLSRCLSFLVFT